MHFFSAGFFSAALSEYTVRWYGILSIDILRELSIIEVLFRISEPVLITILDLIVFGRHSKVRHLGILRCQAVVIDTHSIIRIQTVLPILEFKQVERLMLVRLLRRRVINLIRVYMVVVKSSNIGTLYKSVILCIDFKIHRAYKLFLYTCNTVVHTIPELQVR